MLFLRPVHARDLYEVNHCHGLGTKGHPCEGAEPTKRQRLGRRRGGEDYRLVFRSELNRTRPGWSYQLSGFATPDGFTEEDRRKMNRARVVLTFEPGTSAHLGAPSKWTAPNGVSVGYLKGGRRGKGGVGVYHDFNVSYDEFVVPMTRNVGSGRRALRAWAAKFLAPTPMLRFQARQMVRPGD